MDSNNANKSKARFEILDNGQLKITGNFILKDLKRNFEETSEEVILCLCGKTQNKPFCDGSHDK